jgi:hypothetical protein
MWRAAKHTKQLEAGQISTGRTELDWAPPGPALGKSSPPGHTLQTGNPPLSLPAKEAPSKRWQPNRKVARLRFRAVVLLSHDF